MSDRPSTILGTSNSRRIRTDHDRLIREARAAQLHSGVAPFSPERVAHLTDLLTDMANSMEHLLASHTTVTT